MSITRHQPRLPSRRRGAAVSQSLRCQRKFLRFFPDGFQDKKYHAWERDYKWEAHQAWETNLNEASFRSMLRRKQYAEIAAHAVRLESRTNLLFSFEKMALRDAVKSPPGAKLFAEGLFEFIYGKGPNRFDAWCRVVAALPRKQTRVLTWPLVTVFPFIARPDIHIFLKPMVTRRAAAEYGIEFDYQSRPSAETYQNLLAFAETLERDLSDMRPKDMIDIQSFIWVLGSDEYEE